MREIRYAVVVYVLLFGLGGCHGSTRSDGQEVRSPGARPHGEDGAPGAKALTSLEADVGGSETAASSWVELDGVVYGAKPDDRGPIGGGKGYTQMVLRGDRTVSTLDQLLDALKDAKPGTVIFISGKAEIDCTARVAIERLVLAVPQGVTLASDRGQGDSQGALIFSDAFNTLPLVRATGPDVRITGLRLRGPDPRQRLDHYNRSFAEGRGHTYYYKFPVSRGVATTQSALTVDNCELSGWSHAAVFLEAGDNHQVHHNFIHHNQYAGLGYGVSLDVATALIEFNVFNYNRHSIAGTGRPGCAYEAANNIQLDVASAHCFDMHGGADRKDGTDVAGQRLSIHHNTFRALRGAVTIRGRPQDQAEIHHNWFSQPTLGQAVTTQGKAMIHDNVFGLDRPQLAPASDPGK